MEIDGQAFVPDHAHGSEKHSAIVEKGRPNNGTGLGLPIKHFIKILRFENTWTVV
jgi:hypothetical protein